MIRLNFSAKTKREALARSGGRCEAIGVIYGHPPNERCSTAIYKGAVQFDHYPLLAIDEDSDTLDNCVACCPECHRWKTAHYDIPMIAKGRRIRRGRGPVEGRRKKTPIRTRKQSWGSRKMQSRGFEKRTT